MKKIVPNQRKSKTAPFHSRKQIQCPKCGSRVIDASIDIRTEIMALSAKTRQMSDYFTKCDICGAEIGIRKLS